MFNTHLYAPGFQTSGGTNTSGGVPKAYQSKQLKFVEKKQTGSSAASTISRKSSKSNHSSDSSTKSSFFSSWTGSRFNPNESVNSKSTVSTEETEAAATAAVEEDQSKNNGSEEPTQKKEPEDTIQPELEKEVLLTTSELTIVVEDHSSDSPSDATTVQRVDSLSPGQMGLLRRPSIADLISQFQLPSSSQHPSHAPNELLLKRVTSWEYLGWVHHGKMAYFNTILLTEADLRKFYTSELVQKR
jgi:hypothetical protein